MIYLITSVLKVGAQVTLPNSSEFFEMSGVKLFLVESP
jgi:hypothetical protein